jgi:hypothetical protein
VHKLAFPFALERVLPSLTYNSESCSDYCYQGKQSYEREASGGLTSLHKVLLS